MKRWMIGMIILGMFMISCGNKEKAINRKMAALEQESSLAMMNKDFEKAAELLSKAVELDPERQELRNNLAVIYAGYLNRPDKARELWEGLLVQAPKNAAYMNNLATIYQGEANYDKAIELYENAKEIHTSYHMPYYNIGMLQIYLGKYEEAVAELKMGLRLSPGDSKMIETLGKALILAGNIEEAQTLIGESYRKRPQDIMLAHFLCLIEKRKGNYKRADEIMDECLKFDPNSAWIWAEKTDLAFQLDKDTEAITVLLNKIKSLKDNEIKVWLPAMVEGRLSLLANEIDAGVQTLEQLEGKIPPEWRYFDGIRNYILYEIYRETDKDKAATALSRAEEFAPELYMGLLQPDSEV